MLKEDFSVEVPALLEEAVSVLLPPTIESADSDRRIVVSDATKRICENALQIAKDLNNNYAGTDSLFLACFFDDTCSRFLSKRGIAFSAVLESIKMLLGIEKASLQELLTVELALPEFVQDDSVTDHLVALFSALNDMNCALGGPGLEVAEGEAFLGQPSGVEVLT